MATLSDCCKLKRACRWRKSRDIRRQGGEYRKAVEALSQGNLEAGFSGLDRIGSIREIENAERHVRLASDYVAAIKEGKSALVVAPTHTEGREVTGLIRQELKTAGYLKGKERTFYQLSGKGLTEAERIDAANYHPGDAVRFHQNVRGGFKRVRR